MGLYFGSRQINTVAVARVPALEKPVSGTEKECFVMYWQIESCIWFLDFLSTLMLKEKVTLKRGNLEAVFYFSTKQFPIRGLPKIDHIDTKRDKQSSQRMRTYVIKTVILVVHFIEPVSRIPV